MSRRRATIIGGFIVLVGIAVTAYSFEVARNNPWRVKTIKSNQKSSASNNAPQAYLHRGLLRPDFIPKLNALGDRLEKPGKERLTLVGTLTSAGEAQPSHVVAILEFRDHLYLTISGHGQAKVISFDGENPATSVGGSLEPQDLDLVETLVYDVTDHFLSTQTRGLATRSLGARFRIDDGSARTYVGPYYDIYEVNDKVITSPEPRQQRRLYEFNSETLLLGRVCYQIERRGQPLKIETDLGGWFEQSSQQLPRRIERLVNGSSVFLLTIDAATVGPHVNDGIFASKL